MQFIHSLRDPVAAGILWSIMAVGSQLLRADLEAALLMWAPSGVAVAAFHSIPRRLWPRLIAVLLAAQVLTMAYLGASLLSTFGYALSNLAQAVICATLNVMVLGSRTGVPRKVQHVVGLFGAAATGCLAGAAIAFPFRPEQSLSTFGWWLFANILAILIVTPALLHLRGALQRLKRSRRLHIDRQLVFALISCALLAIVALEARQVILMPLLIAAMIAMAVRFGHAAIAMTLLVYAVVATSLSLGGGSPMPFYNATPVQATLVMQSWMLTMLATALPLAALLLKREEMQLELVSRNASLHDNLLMLDLSERLAGLGRWRLDLVTGEQDWSPRMLELCGLAPDLLNDPREFRDHLPDHGDRLFSEFARRREECDPYSFDYTATPLGGSERILRISVLNEFDQDGRCIALFGVAMDVTEQVTREMALDMARGRAVRMAAQAQKLANTDPLTNLPNRRCTFAQLDSMVEVAGSCGSPLSAIIFDIDHFKIINDTHGHATGDEVIVQVAQLARRQARSSDVVGRIGGEEFVWLLPGFDAPAARALAERLRGSVECGIEGSSLPNVTISVGLAQFKRGDRGEHLLARADAALYQAKQSGRNQVRRAA